MKNEAKHPVNSVHIPSFLFHILFALLFLGAGVSISVAQNSAKPQTPPKFDSTELKSTYVFGGIGAFIPTGQSYSQNYSTKLAGLPVEISGGLLIPVSNDLFVPFTARYVRRIANFVSGSEIDVLSIEPGVRYYLERQRFKELRLYGAVSLLLTRASVSGNYDVSKNGTVTGTSQANVPYLDIGTGVDLGFSYPLTPSTSLDVAVHIAVYFASPVSDGGVGNIGGVSLCAAYRFGF